MKRLFVFLISLLVLSLSACNNGNSNSKSNVISAVDLNEREDVILSTISEESFVFDFNIDTEYKEVGVWLEKYESGELVDDKLGYMTTQTDKNGTIILATSKSNDNEKKHAFNIGIGDKNGTSSTNFSDKDSNDICDMQSVSGEILKEVKLTGKEIMLAYIAYSNDENSISSLSTDFYEDPEAHVGELAEYDVAYLLKVEFMK